MRDANGTGNIFFDDLFKDDIPAYSLIFYVLNLGFSMANVVWIPTMFYWVILGSSAYHKNLRIVLSNLYFAFFLLAFGDFGYSLLVLTRTSDTLYDRYFSIFRFIASLGPGIWRSTFVAIVLERTVATVFCRSYEKKGPLWLGILLFLIGQLGVLIPLLYFIIRVHFLVSIIFVFSNDFTCVITLFLLVWSNKKHRKLKFNTTIELTQRYQLIENLKVVSIMTPVIVMGTIFDVTAISLYTLQTFIDFNSQLLYPMYLLVPNVYVFLVFIFYLKRDKKLKRKLFGRCFNLNLIEPIRVEVLNFDGKPLIIQDNADNRFNNLLQTWNSR